MNVHSAAPLSAAALAMWISAAASAPPSAPASERARAVANAFASYCLKPEPDFDRISRLATADGAALQTDTRSRDGSSRERSWQMKNAGGPAALHLQNEVMGPLHVVLCWLMIPGIDADDLKRALTAVPQLGAPAPKSGAPPQAGRSAMWPVELGAARELPTWVDLREHVPTSSGVYVGIQFAAPVR